MSRWRAVRVVVFDVDDTLYLERDYVRSGFRAVDAAVAERHGAAGFFGEAWSAFESGLRGRIFDAALTAMGIAPTRENVEPLVAVYRSHAPDITLLPDARAALEALQGRVALAAVTDGPPESQRAKVRALQLEDWCRPVILTAELGEGFGKPHPRAFALVEERLGLPGASCVYLADNPAKDFEGPRSRGWLTVRVRRAGGLHEAVEASGVADEVWPDLQPLPALLVAMERTGQAASGG